MKRKLAKKKAVTQTQETWVEMGIFEESTETHPSNNKTNAVGLAM